VGNSAASSRWLKYKKNVNSKNKESTDAIVSSRNTITCQSLEVTRCSMVWSSVTRGHRVLHGLTISHQRSHSAAWSDHQSLEVTRCSVVWPPVTRGHTVQRGLTISH